MSGPNPSGLCMCGCGQKTRISKKTRTHRGVLKGCHVRFLPQHQFHLLRRPADERFWEKVDKDTESGCWEWTASLDAYGYGKFSPTHGSSARAHRFSYRALVGDVPDGFDLDHLCRNCKCVNPDHLEAVTHAENMRRGSNTKLTPEQVREIRCSPETSAAMARRFGVTASHVNHIRTGKKWVGV